MAAYRLMSGFRSDGSPITNPETGEVTTFFNPGDPNEDTGPGDGVWVDADDYRSGDRKFLANMGPFAMSPGDSQEVVFVVILTQGADALDSVTKLKAAARLAANFWEEVRPADTYHYPLPQWVKLYQSYPNPITPFSSPIITIQFALTETAPVKLEVYNLMGQSVAVLLQEVRDEGLHQVVWNGCNYRGIPAPAGIYFYRLTTGSATQTKKMVLLR